MPNDDLYSDDLDDLDQAIQRPVELPKNNQAQTEAAAIASLLSHFGASLHKLTDDQVRLTYSRCASEVLRRGVKVEMLGDSHAEDMSQVSIEREFMAMIRLAQQMRQNLQSQLASSAGASSREIQSTLKATLDTIKTLTTYQESIMSLERQRILETVLLEVLGTLSEAARKDFTDTLRERLEQATKR